MTKIRAQSAARERRETQLVSASFLASGAWGGEGGTGLRLSLPRALSTIVTSRWASQQFSSSVLSTLPIEFLEFHLKEEVSSSSQLQL